MTQEARCRLRKSRFFISALAFVLASPLLQAQMVATRDARQGESNRTLFIQAARTYIGVPYATGGTSVKGMDCSGLIYRAALDGLSMEIPRTVASLSSRSEKIPDLAREPGDLLFFNTTGVVSHVGIYLGGGTFVHAASDGPRTGVIISNLGEDYWKRTYRFTGRIFLQEGLKMPDGENMTAPTVNPFPFGGEIGLRLNYTGGLLWDFMPGSFPVRGGSAFAEVSWAKNTTVYPGIGAGMAWDDRSKSFSFPLFASIATVDGFRFFIGTQLHVVADPALDSSPQFPGIIGLSWNSKPATVLGQKLRFYQSAEYSWFPGETFGSGLRLNTGLTVTCDI